MSKLSFAAFPVCFLSALAVVGAAPLVIGAAPALGASKALPPGPGKETVEAVCTSCHDTRQILRSSGYRQGDWDKLIATMVDLSDSSERDTITQYLATQFPPNTRRQAKLVPGDHSIAFKEWVVPILGQRSRDPVEAADGAIWWAGQWGNLIGRIDPTSGEMNEYPLPEKAMPHTVTTDAAGNIWYTGNKNGTVGKLDPKTEKITEYKMPDPAAKDPHSAIFDRNGTLWFTLQHSNMVGRLDPKSGDIRLVTMPRPGSRPYGIKLDSSGAPWIACNGSNCIARIDPATMNIRVFPLPNEKTKVRRLDIADDDTIWYVNSSQGRLGHLDPKTGAVREWPSPSGPTSHPYAIAIIDGIVWYNESGVRPDPLVRFDPKTETFQSWAIPSGDVHAGIVRHMRKTKDGNLLIHQSATNRIILVTINGGTKTQ
jgi:virginiamycin B lyase